MRHLEKSVNIVLLLLLAELFQVLGFTHFGKTHLMSDSGKLHFLCQTLLRPRAWFCTISLVLCLTCVCNRSQHDFNLKKVIGHPLLCKPNCCIVMTTQLFLSCRGAKMKMGLLGNS